MSSAEVKDKIRAMFIIEVIGKPPEHLTETLDKIIEQMGKEKGVEIIDKKIKEPVKLKESKEIYTNFAEIEVEAEEAIILAILMFKYMPSHIEVLYPENIVLSNSGWTDILSELTRRLHAYDEVARVLQVEKNILEKKLRELLPDKKKE